MNQRPGSHAALGRRLMLLLGASGVVSGCGFQPVYKAAGEGPGPAGDLAAIEVKPIYERPGQILREALRARLASDSGTPRRYDLLVRFWIAGEGVGVLSGSELTRIRLTGNATWTLVTRDARQTKLAEGSERVIDGVDLFESQYFALDLDNERVQRRVAETVADKIALRLAVWFQRRAAAPG